MIKQKVDFGQPFFVNTKEELRRGITMKKYIIFGIVLFSSTAYGADYHCSVARQDFRNGEFYTTSYTKGIIHDTDKTIGFNAFDNKDSYTSGILSERKTDVMGIEKEFR